VKRLQNRIAEGGFTLPVAALFAIGVWLYAGLVTQHLWPQLACFIASIYLLVELTNQNALLRVRSRMVSSTFIVLSCTASFLFPSMTGAMVQMLIIGSLMFLFQTYQDPLAMGRTFYAFLGIGLASLAFVQTLWYVPLLWVLMATQLQSLNWRSWLASVIGLTTPYWFALLWLLTPFSIPEEGSIDLTPLAEHFSLFVPQFSTFAFHLSPLTTHLYPLLFTIVLAGVGMFHFWQYSFEDKIRIRLLYGFFTSMTIYTLVLILMQPQHADVLMRILFVCASPIIAHVMTFTSSRLSNILFFVAIAIAIALTVISF